MICSFIDGLLINLYTQIYEYSFVSFIVGFAGERNKIV